MQMQEIYEHIFPEVLGKTRVLYFPMPIFPSAVSINEKVIAFETELLESNEIEEMELMYMEYNTKVYMLKIPIKQLTNIESNDHFLRSACRV